MTNTEIKRNPEDCELLHGFLFQHCFNPYLKNESSKDEIARTLSERERPALVPTNEGKNDYLAKRYEIWGSHEIVDCYDTYDKDINDEKVEQSGPGLVCFLQKPKSNMW